MNQHDGQLNKEKNAQRRPIHPIQKRQQLVHGTLPSNTTPSFISVPASTITSTSNASSSSSNSTLILDPPPPYVPPRAHSSNDVNLSNFTAIPNPSSNPSLRNNRKENSNLFASKCPSAVISTSGSGSASPGTDPVSGSSARAETSAPLRKASSSEDILWTDKRRHRLRRRNGRSCSNAVGGYDSNDGLREEYAMYSDGEIQDSARPIVNEHQYDERLYTYISSDHDYDEPDYVHLTPISPGLENGTGETETEVEEQSQKLSTSRKIPPLQPQLLLDFISGPSPTSPLSRNPPTPPILAQLSKSQFTPVLFELFRLLSVVPAGLGFVWHLWCFICAVQSFTGRDGDSRLREITRDVSEFAEFKFTIHTPFDHFVCILWTLLTAHQCLALTTGLQLRWRAYYPSHATLIRLLALQAICWPATQYTLRFVNHDVRPVVCWALIGSTTCFSRAVQIWVVSNLKVVRHGISKVKTRTNPHDYDDTDTSEKADLVPRTNSGFLHHADSCHDAVTIKWVVRRWDWPLVMRTCVLPAAMVYFVMAWVGELRREVVRWE